MIVSHLHKFIFIRTRKTASTSMEIALAGICGDDDIITPMTKHYETWRERHGQNYGDLRNHVNASVVRRFVGDEVWCNYFKFCFDRNPFDKIVSLFWHRIRSRQLDPARCSFADFVKSGAWSTVNNWKRYTVDGKVVVNFIGRYENLQDDWRKACNLIGIPVLELPNARTDARQDRRHYREIFGDINRSGIEREFAREIAYHGYTF